MRWMYVWKCGFWKNGVGGTISNTSLELTTPRYRIGRSVHCHRMNLWKERCRTSVIWSERDRTSEKQVSVWWVYLYINIVPRRTKAYTPAKMIGRTWVVNKYLIVFDTTILKLMQIQTTPADDSYIVINALLRCLSSYRGQCTCNYVFPFSALTLTQYVLVESVFTRLKPV